MSEAEPPPDADHAAPGRGAPAEDVETYVRAERAPEETPQPSWVETLLAQVLLPLLLTPLITIPVDFVAALLWLVAALCLLVSMISAVIRLLTIGFGASSQRRGRLLRLIRPMLTITVVCTAHICVQHSIYVAQHEVAVIAATIQSEGRSAGTYPEVLPGWREERKLERKCSRRNFGWTADYRATYSANEARDGFTLSLRLDTDTSMVISGGKETDLSVRISNYMLKHPPRMSMEELLNR